jgi:hypothetical protein
MEMEMEERWISEVGLYSRRARARADPEVAEQRTLPNDRDVDPTWHPVFALLLLLLLLVYVLPANFLLSHPFRHRGSATTL